ncbi:hypothetical protein [Aquifex sp.]
MRFKLRDRSFELSRKEVTEILSGKNYEQNGSRYFIELEGKYIPAKEALYRILKSKGIKLTKLDFTTQDAVRIFRRLGFEVVVKGKRKKTLDDLVGVIKGGGDFNAVEDKVKLYGYDS